jgi:DNA-binding MarR family transcriptional regulator
MSINLPLSLVLRTWVEVFMHRSFRDFRRFMEGAGISHSQVGALMQLYCEDACGVSDIGEHLGISVPAASQLVDRLVQQGLLERIEYQADRRYKQVSLTSKGRQLIESGIEYRQKWMEQLTQALTPEEQQVISGALSLLNRAAQQLDTDPSGTQYPGSPCIGLNEKLPTGSADL